MRPKNAHERGEAVLHRLPPADLKLVVDTFGSSFSEWIVQVLECGHADVLHVSAYRTLSVCRLCDAGWFKRRKFT